jgi:hypothetical protein
MNPFPPGLAQLIVDLKDREEALSIDTVILLLQAPGWGADRSRDDWMCLYRSLVLVTKAAKKVGV